MKTVRTAQRMLTGQPWYRPRACRRSFSSSETSTFVGVSRKTWSATPRHRAADPVRQAAREVDQAALQVAVDALQVHDHGLVRLQPVADLLRVVEAVRLHDVHRAMTACASRSTTR